MGVLALVGGLAAVLALVGDPGVVLAQVGALAAVLGLVGDPAVVPALMVRIPSLSRGGLFKRCFHFESMAGPEGNRSYVQGECFDATCTQLIIHCLVFLFAHGHHNNMQAFSPCIRL